ncbi:thiamine diphosphokinase [Breznakiellaceae bacterium SP9]
MVGIAFIGGDGPAPETARALARDADLIVAADSGLIAAENAGIRPDWIVGDMDSLDSPTRLDKYPAKRIMRSKVEKDETDTELALKLLIAQGCTQTRLIGGGGGRIDHIFAIRALFDRPLCPERWYTANENIYCVQSGCSMKGKREPGSLVSVFPVWEGPWGAQSSGLKWPLDDIAWNRGFCGISNFTTKDQFTILSKQGRFLVIY